MKLKMCLEKDEKQFLLDLANKGAYICRFIDCPKGMDCRDCSLDKIAEELNDVSKRLSEIVNAMS